MNFPIRETRSDRAGFNQLARLHAATKDLCFDTVELDFSLGLEKFERLDNPFPGTCINIEIDTADTMSYRLSSEADNPL